MTTSAEKILIGEFALATAYAIGAGIIEGYVPYPARLVRVGLSFAFFGVISLFSEKTAAALGAGFLLAQFLTRAGRIRNNQLLDFFNDQFWFRGNAVDMALLGAGLTAEKNTYQLMSRPIQEALYS